MNMSLRALALALLQAGALAGCGVPGPVNSPSAWHPVGANDINLAAMIADPVDLVNGAATPVADGATAADAVARYHAGKVKKLPDSGISKVAPSGAGGGSDAAAAP